MNPLLELKKGTPLLVVLFALACLAVSPQARAVCRDGCENNLNTFQGEHALISNTTGFDNSAFGYSALYYNTTGYANAAFGTFALESNASGNFNTASGYGALGVNTAGDYNTANGARALESNETGSYNTAVGAYALSGDTSGVANIGVGVNALRSNHSGSFNTAVGVDALYRNDATGGGLGNSNSAFGIYALFLNTDGADNSAFGSATLAFNTTGNSNTGMGENALFGNTAGDGNTAVGTGALYYNTNGSDNIALGNAAGRNLTIGDNNIDIGNVAVAAEANTIRIGTQGTQTSAYVAGIFGATVTDGAPVIVDTNGHLGTVVSSARFKDEIKPMDKASAVILALKPVTFRYTKERDPKRIPQFGLVAEDVEKTDPDLVIRDRDGKPYTVRYDAVNVMLLNEFLKEHRKVQKLEAALDTVSERLKKQDAKIQKVSAQVEMANPASRVVANKP